MLIKYTILGFLSWRALTGYELKKLFAESATLYWSGNSNQIYTALVELHKEDLISLEIQPQGAHPPRKVYTVTDKGLAALKSWMLSAPEPPLQKNALLIQLAWADLLEADDIDALLEKYEDALHTQLLLFCAHDQRKDSPQRTPREVYLWSMIAENWIAFYENDLRWVQRLRIGLARMKKEEK